MWVSENWWIALSGLPGLPETCTDSTEAWPQGAAQTGIQDDVSQEEGFHVRTS